jgi:abortive infection bacteriophage resistance protein
VGYYRLCAYWYPFKNPDNTFHINTRFDVVWDRYTFDRQLRLIAMDAIERVEVAVRSVLVTELAMTRGPFAHLDIRSFPGTPQAKHDLFIDDLREGARRSSEAFVEHLRTVYDEFPDLPIWAAAEIMSFGALLTMYRRSSRQVRSAVAHPTGIPEPVFSSWLLTLNYVRNICAHHSRLWNRELAIKPVVPRHDQRWHGAAAIGNNRVFAVLTLLHRLLQTIAPNTQWKQRVFALFDRFKGVPLPAMGMTASWRNHQLWQ